MSTPNDMPQHPRLVSNELLMAGLQIWNEGEDGKLRKGEILRERLESLGCPNPHFLTLQGQKFCYDRSASSYVTL